MKIDEHFIPMTVYHLMQEVSELTALAQDSKTSDQVAAEAEDLNMVYGQLGRLLVRIGKHRLVAAE